MSKVYQLIQKVNNYNRKLIPLLIFFSIIIAFLEILGISLFFTIIPFIFNQSDKVYFIFDFFNFFFPIDEIRIFNLSVKNSQFLFLFILLVVLYIVKNFLIFTFSFLRFKILMKSNNELTTNLYKSYLVRKYKFFIKKNKSYYIHNLTNTGRVTKALLNITNIFTELVLFFGILIILIYQDPIITLFIFLITTLISLIYLKASSQTMKILGKKNEILSTLSLKTFNESLSSIREITFFNLHNFFYKKFANNYIDLNNVRLKLQTINLIPSLLYETLLVIIVSTIFLFFLFQNYEIQYILSTLSIMAISVLKLLPSTKKIVMEKNALRNFEFLAKNISQDIQFKQKEKNDNKELIFKKDLKLKNLYFKHERKNYLFRNFNFKIKRGEKIAIIGKTGSGKSTLLDLITGLIDLNKGQILFDGKNINEIKREFIDSFFYLSQNIFIYDDSISFNVSLKENPSMLERKKIIFLLKKLHLGKIIPKNNLNRKIGEMGVKISGGQKQRLGIARALFVKKPILLFDEVTSALDEKTAKNVINFILSIKKKETIIMVTHNLNLAKKFDKIIELKN
jgi:ABC-type bacteriocin/lantibiotic exporter with double-glycine peptidase domain